MGAHITLAGEDHFLHEDGGQHDPPLDTWLPAIGSRPCRRKASAAQAASFITSWPSASTVSQAEAMKAIAGMNGRVRRSTASLAPAASFVATSWPGHCAASRAVATQVVAGLSGRPWRHAGPSVQATGFVESRPSGSHVSAEEAKKAIAEVNSADAKLWRKILKDADALPALRKEVDAVMVKRMDAMKPLCKEYLTHRAELAGPAGEQCVAAQGHLNASDVGDTGGPHGCLPDDASEFASVPKELPEARCTAGFRQLQCSERLRELQDGLPAPGVAEAHEKEAAKEAAKARRSGDRARQPEEQKDWSIPSMDKQVRDWCHPLFALRGKRISPELASGVDSVHDAKQAEDDEEPSQA